MQLVQVLRDLGCNKDADDVELEVQKSGYINPNLHSSITTERRSYMVNKISLIACHP